MNKSKSIVIIANGPSRVEMALEELDSHIDTLTINVPDMRVFPSTFWMMLDYNVVKRHEDLLNDYKGKFLCSSAVLNKYHGPHTLVKCKQGFGFSIRTGQKLFIGHSTTYVAAQGAFVQGYDKIFIVGMDIGKVNGKLYEWGGNPYVSDSKRINRFIDEAKYWNWLSNYFPRSFRNRIYLCSKYLNYNWKDKFNKAYTIEEINRTAR